MIEDGIVGFKVIVETEKIEQILTCPYCGAEHNLADLIALMAENNLKELPDLACFHCHHTFDLSETKEFEDVRKNFFKAFVRFIAKIKNIPEDDADLTSSLMR